MMSSDVPGAAGAAGVALAAAGGLRLQSLSQAVAAPAPPSPRTAPSPRNLPMPGPSPRAFPAPSDPAPAQPPPSAASGPLGSARGSAFGAMRLQSIDCSSAPAASASPAFSTLEAWELALEAWVDLRAQGYTIEERRIRELLPTVATHVPRPSIGGASSAPPSARGPPSARAAAPPGGGAGGAAIGELFAPTSGGGPPVFLSLLKAQRGQVHFLYFWKAFGEASKVAGVRFEDGLTVELEVLRDRLLRRLEEATAAAAAAGAQEAGGSPLPSARMERQALPTWALVEEVHRAAAMSAYPRFWQRVSDCLAGQLELEELSVEELTSVLLAWLHDTQLWEQNERMKAQDSRRGSSGQQPSTGISVRLHIYDVSQEEGIQKLNRILAHKHSPLKFGGVFHAGVEVNGLEWSYGYSPSESRPGVSCVEPRMHPQHHFRQTVHLRPTQKQAEEIGEIISKLVEEYPGPDYNLLRRNCCHFADDFCRRLGVGGIPGWVHRLARLGAGVDTLLQNAPQPIKDRVYG